MSDHQQLTSKENIRRLVEGELPLEMIHEMVRMQAKDEDRFFKYLEVLQERVDWEDSILARISDHLYVVAKDGGERDCEVRLRPRVRRLPGQLEDERPPVLPAHRWGDPRGLHRPRPGCGVRRGA